MIVVSDATPLNILIRIEAVGVLPVLFGSIIVPPAVSLELSRPATPATVRDWISHAPGWLSVRPPERAIPDLGVDAGEAEAISLALELCADFVLIDDKKARRAARAQGLTVTGTLAVLETAAARGLLDLPEAVERLRASDFQIAGRLLDDALRRDNERRKA